MSDDALPTDRAYAAIPISERPGKPRETGITMMIDLGISHLQLESHLEMIAPYLDLGKIAVGMSGLMRLEDLQRKIKLYQAHDVEPFPGGMFLEYARARGKVPEFFDATLEAGYRTVEVSDNARPIPPDEKAALVTAGLDRGLRVLGEADSNEDKIDPEALVNDVLRLLDAGCWKVFVESLGLFDEAGAGTELLDALVERCPIEQLIFELPGPWLPGVHENQIHRLMGNLLRRFGPEVNLANVRDWTVLGLETARRGIGNGRLPDEASDSR